MQGCVVRAREGRWRCARRSYQLLPNEELFSPSLPSPPEHFPSSLLPVAILLLSILLLTSSPRYTWGDHHGTQVYPVTPPPWHTWSGSRKPPYRWRQCEWSWLAGGSSKRGTSSVSHECQASSTPAWSSITRGIRYGCARKFMVAGKGVWSGAFCGSAIHVRVAEGKIIVRHDLRAAFSPTWMMSGFSKKCEWKKKCVAHCREDWRGGGGRGVAW